MARPPKTKAIYFHLEGEELANFDTLAAKMGRPAAAHILVSYGLENLEDALAFYGRTLQGKRPPKPPKDAT